MRPEDIERLAKILPEYPRNLTPIEWVAIAFVAVVAICFLVDRVWTAPRAARRKEEAEAARLVAAAAEREKERVAYLGQLDEQSCRTSAALDKIVAAHERATERLHDRLDGVSADVQRVGRQVVQLSCYQGEQTTQPRAQAG